MNSSPSPSVAPFRCCGGILLHPSHLNSLLLRPPQTLTTLLQVLWWDIRKLSECVESMPLREKGSETNLGGVIIEYDPAAGPTNFMIGTEQVRGRGRGGGEGGGLRDHCTGPRLVLQPHVNQSACLPSPSLVCRAKSSRATARPRTRRTASNTCCRGITGPSAGSSATPSTPSSSSA